MAIALFVLFSPLRRLHVTHAAIALLITLLCWTSSPQPATAANFSWDSSHRTARDSYRANLSRLRHSNSQKPSSSQAVPTAPQPLNPLPLETEIDAEPDSQHRLTAPTHSEPLPPELPITSSPTAAPVLSSPSDSLSNRAKDPFSTIESALHPSSSEANQSLQRELRLKERVERARSNLQQLPALRDRAAQLQESVQAQLEKQRTFSQRKAQQIQTTLKEQFPVPEQTTAYRNKLRVFATKILKRADEAIDKAIVYIQPPQD